MKYIGFQIKNFRAIEYIEVQISNSLIPIIGINESGKTSVLKAILSFDKLKDNYNKGEHLTYKNKYTYKNVESTIVASILFETEEEVEKIAKKMKLKVGDEVYDALKNIYQSNIPINIARNLESKKYSVVGFPIENEKNEVLANKIFEELPIILYFDDFSDRVPETIEFPLNYLEKGLRSNNSTKAEWRNLLEEIFLRSTNGENELKDFLNMTDEDDKAALLSDVSDQLNIDIINEWKNLKSKGSTSLANDEDDLELLINYVPPTEDNESYRFQFKVIDKTLQGKRRQFNVVERSKGFQWYFNFIIKLKFNAKYKNNPANAIYLLDEPGSYLHSSAQEELLSELKEISIKNTLLYCTHSQYLLDPDRINVSTIKIAVKQEGKVNLISFNSYGKNNSQGALSPLLDALHLKTGMGNIDKKCLLITEGITDYYLISMLIKYRDDFNHDELCIIPGSGAQNLKELISLSIASADKYLVLLDNDDAGQLAYRKYMSYFDGENANIKFYNPLEKPFELEDFIIQEDAERIKHITQSSNLKTSIVGLYFLSDEQLKRRTIRKLNNEKLANLDELLTSHF
ncbi:ATP-binding protein [Sporosarcina aquimarina]|uniref:ATP-dependent nuclease n=1 Tax=Sporosarcina aquimarina TaxID=114975 RepID=UPI00203F3B58|nr:AAA family ATPase [Sporosarcina aquimarina]MCM3758720.1 ATP-binding protein [Sporosarcina aquimarina]